MPLVDEAFCKKCPFEKHLGYSCCAIYRKDNGHIGKGMEREEVRKLIHGDNDYSKAKVNDGQGDWCEYFDNGCTLNDERPKICKDYACYYLKNHMR